MQTPRGVWSRSRPSPSYPVCLRSTHYLPYARSPVRDVLRAQDRLDRANATGDPATFAGLTAPNFVLVTAHGLIRTKADRVIEERIRRLEDRPSRPLPGRDDEHIRRYGPVAVITARTWPRAADGHARAPSRFTRVWVEQSGAWQQLANITTPLAP